jgi:hypothetical protein
MRMKAKLRLFAASFLIVLTFSLGTGYLMFGGGPLANNNYSLLGLYALNSIERNTQSSGQGTSTISNFPIQSSSGDFASGLISIEDSMNRAAMRLELQKMQSSDLDISASLNFSTDLNIENLTLDEIQFAKQSIENVMSRAFMKWQLQKMLSGELKPFTSPPNNETVREMLFQFLSERPDCAERFAQYDRMLSRENQLRLPEQNLELEKSFQNINLVVEKGEILREWNTTQIINGSEYFVVNREYAMNVNGTIQKIVKVYVYSYDGNEIIDPYMCIKRVPLLWPCCVWVFWWPYYIGWWGTVILYGYDFYLYLSFTVEEQPWWKGWTYYQTLGSVTPDWFNAAQVGFSFAGITGFLSYFATGALMAILTAASAVCAVGSFALAAAYVAVHTFMLAVWENFVNTETYNWFHDPNFGFKEVEYFHCPLTPPTTANPPCFDVQPFITPYYIRVDNWWYKLPWPHSIYLNTGDSLWNAYVSFITVWGTTLGFNTWVWVGPFPTNWPPPPPV